MALWKDIAGYEGMYQVSDEGDVMSLPHMKHNGRGSYITKAKVLRVGKRGNGDNKYLFVVLANNGVDKQFSVHRLVAEAFLDNPQNLPEVNHKDENPFNNCVENLEWCTRQYNIEYSKSKPICQYALDGTLVAKYRNAVIAAKITGISRQAICNNLNGWSETSGGYVWKYEVEE